MKFKFWHLLVLYGVAAIITSYRVYQDYTGINEFTGFWSSMFGLVFWFGIPTIVYVIMNKRQKKQTTQTL